MILIDANLLLYAYDPRSEHHAASRTWLESTLSGSQLVRFAWMTLWAFLRITTNARVYERPLSMAEAEDIVASLLAQPVVGILEPGERHWELLRRLTRDGQTTGTLVMDAVLAALAVEHGATLHTTDRDFARFSELRWTNPIATR
ncbi:MAG: type II toxin-antitoxin system VapC family toxin [Acidobacteria bacterium]|nr:MAG: type II toxin-antitoxin system VapC family toxin [Acidobacteriota bacterium]